MTRKELYENKLHMDYFQHFMFHIMGCFSI